ncbi:hypothetical protein GGI42DRAFT_363557 [Trichoderma sp. SZMC 28013]
MTSRADQEYQLEQRLETHLLESITKDLLLLCGQKARFPLTPVTKPSIDKTSWVYESSGFGAKIIQEPAPKDLVLWREYEPDGRDRAPIVVHYSAKMNGDTHKWKFQLAIHDPDQFWEYLQQKGNPKAGLEGYQKLLATLWSETYKVSFKTNKRRMSMEVIKIETVNFPKANK